eukprot:gene16641-19772_t
MKRSLTSPAVVGGTPKKQTTTTTTTAATGEYPLTPGTKERHCTTMKQANKEQKDRIAKALKAINNEKAGLKADIKSAGRDDLNKDEMSITFRIMGSVPIPYNVTIQRQPSCSCPDFPKRQNYCKHMAYVLLKEFKLAETNELLWQKGFTIEEIELLFDSLNGDVDPNTIPISVEDKKGPAKKTTPSKKRSASKLAEQTEHAAAAVGTTSPMSTPSTWSCISLKSLSNSTPLDPSTN